ncbi:MAG: hypothetical protein RDU14_15390 [Melioribacteraceae bacterium]|nr:hypothetical protein [Melioribacteraceae bacterium]
MQDESKKDSKSALRIPIFRYEIPKPEILDEEKINEMKWFIEHGDPYEKAVMKQCLKSLLKVNRMEHKFYAERMAKLHANTKKRNSSSKKSKPQTN